jgi:protein O-GlcNAc transferase
MTLNDLLNVPVHPPKGCGVCADASSGPLLVRTSKWESRTGDISRAEVHAETGRDHFRRRAYDKASESFRAALAFGDRRLNTVRYYIACLAYSNRLDEAEEFCKNALAAHPDDPSLQNDLGVILLGSRRWEEAARVLRPMVRQHPTCASAHRHLAKACNHLHDVRGAFASALRAIELDPDDPSAHAELGVALERQGKLGAAAASFQRIVEMLPADPTSYVLLAGVKLQQLEQDAALELFRRARTLAPESPRVQEMTLLASCYAASEAESTIIHEHVQWAALAIKAASRPVILRRKTHRRLRVGYVSPNLHRHAVSHFIAPIFAAHDREKVDVVVFSDAACPDSVTETLRGYRSEWHTTTALSDERLAGLIRSREIDLLIDLAGHTAENRLLTFARRPAPVQITYLGYPHTTGLPRDVMAYRLTDNVCDPAGGSDDAATEQLVRLPHCFLCYRSNDSAPPVTSLPCGRNRHITFGCFNGLMKVTGPIIELWSTLLSRIPRARLVIKNKSLADRATQDRVAAEFAKYGVAERRLVLLPSQPSAAEHIATYGGVDIALDTFPYNGTTTTCEAMWMGVPVVTLAGATHRSRVGASILNAIGMGMYVASTPEQYLQVAENLASSMSELSTLRKELRTRLTDSPLMQEARFVGDLESSYALMWKSFAASEAASEWIYAEA